MTTFDNFFEENQDQKSIYEKECNDFYFSEYILEKIAKENILIQELVKQAKGSPAVIQKLRIKDAE